jgi:RNA polymerase sigma-70 factor (ECF subfamily)
METLPDRELVELALGGENAALEGLVRRHYNTVYKLAYRLCGAREDAEDIAQDVFVRLARKLSSYKGDSSFKTWLYRITVNMAKDFFKKNSTRRGYESAYVQEQKVLDSASANPGPPEAERLQAALGGLPVKLRETVVLVYSEGMSHAEAAQVLGCAETTVSWRLHQARGKLKSLMGKEV